MIPVCPRRAARLLMIEAEDDSVWSRRKCRRLGSLCDLKVRRRGVAAVSERLTRATVSREPKLVLRWTSAAQTGKTGRWATRCTCLGRSSNPGVVRRTLRMVHIRMWHVPAKRLQDLLRVAGVPPDIIDQVQGIVGTCPVWRNWSQTGQWPMTTSRMVFTFNQELQVDLLCWKSNVVVHIIDICLRWRQGIIVASRETADILNGIVHIWFRMEHRGRWSRTRREPSILTWVECGRRGGACSWSCDRRVRTLA